MSTYSHTGVSASTSGFWGMGWSFGPHSPGRKQGKPQGRKANPSWGQAVLTEGGVGHCPASSCQSSLSRDASRLASLWGTPGRLSVRHLRQAESHAGTDRTLHSGATRWVPGSAPVNLGLEPGLRHWLPQGRVLCDSGHLFWASKASQLIKDI